MKCGVALYSVLKRLEYRELLELLGLLGYGDVAEMQLSSFLG